jgi:GTPase SAR1 family protein
MASNPNKIPMKIGVIGDQGVGKSTFIANFIISSGDNNVINSKFSF